MSLREKIELDSQRDLQRSPSEIMEAIQTHSKNVSNQGIKVETDCGYEIQNDNYQMLVVNSNRAS